MKVVLHLCSPLLLAPSWHSSHLSAHAPHPLVPVIVLLLFVMPVIVIAAAAVLLLFVVAMRVLLLFFIPVAVIVAAAVFTIVAVPMLLLLLVVPVRVSVLVVAMRGHCCRVMDVGRPLVSAGRTGFLRCRRGQGWW